MQNAKRRKYIQPTPLKQPSSRHKHLIEEVSAHLDAGGGSRADAAREHLALEGAEDDHAELDVDVSAPVLPDHALRHLGQVVEGDAEAHAVDYLVGVLFVDLVF